MIDVVRVLFATCRTGSANLFAGRSRRVRFGIALAFSLALVHPSPASATISRNQRLPSVRSVLAAYARAISDGDASDVAHAYSVGSLSGGGLTGTFEAWQAGDDERSDQILGPRVERTLRLADRIFVQDANGDVRRLTGVLQRRDRTQRFIDSGAFAKAPERCMLRGRAIVDGRRTFVMDVAADGGTPETVYLDATTGLPDRFAYDEDDGRTTVDLSDWRAIGGHRFPFKSVESDGDRSFDVTQLTTSVSLDLPIDPAVFAPLVARTIDIPAPVVEPLELRDGHLFVRVRIGDRTYRFLVDTGAQDILIDTHVATELGLHPTGALEASGASRTGGLRVVHLSELDVGGARMRDLVVTTIDLDASTEGAFHIDGILGYPFFAQAEARIDVGARTLTFGPPGSIANAGERIPIDLDRLFPEAVLNVNGKTAAPFIVDTGNAAELLLYRPFVEAHPGVVPFSASDRHSFGIGGETHSYRSTLDEIELGSTPLYNTDTDVMLATRGAFADRFDAGNVGLALLKNFIVTFDYTNGAMYLERGPDFDDGRSRA